MAWAALVPVAIWALDKVISSGDEDAAAKAQQQKLALMKQQAGNLEAYRPGMEEWMMQGHQARMASLGNASNVLSQMYGGHPTNPTAPMRGAREAGAMGISPMGANPRGFQPQTAPMGFGGQQPILPMPADMYRFRGGQGG
jgi:hypothetical protein